MFAPFTIHQRAIAIVAILMLPMAVLLTVVIRQTTEQIDTLKRERIGFEYEDVLVPLYDRLNTYRARANDPDPRPKLQAAAEIEQLFESLVKIHAVRSPMLSLESAPLSDSDRKLLNVKSLQSQWQLLRATGFTAPQMAQLTSQVQALIRLIADASGLVSDSELTTYYMMETALLVVPE